MVGAVGHVDRDQAFAQVGRDAACRPAVIHAIGKDDPGRQMLHVVEAPEVSQPPWLGSDAETTGAVGAKPAEARLTGREHVGHVVRLTTNPPVAPLNFATRTDIQ